MGRREARTRFPFSQREGGSMTSAEMKCPPKRRRGRPRRPWPPAEVSTSAPTAAPTSMPIPAPLPNGTEHVQSPPIALTLSLVGWRKTPRRGDLLGFAEVEIGNINYTLRGCAVWRNTGDVYGVSAPAQCVQSRTGPRWIPAGQWGSPEQAAVFSAAVVELLRDIDPQFDIPEQPAP